MIGLNGGLVGRPRSLYANTGIWTPNEQRLSKNDRYRDNVSLLLHMDGANASTTFTDSSKNALAVTANGNAQISTAQSKFGGASCYLDGTGDYLTLANSSLFDFSTGDFTVEGWAYPAASADFTWISYGTASSTGFFISMNTSTNTISLGVTNVAGNLLQATQLGMANTWKHYAVTRASGLYYMFCDGALLNTSSARNDNLDATTVFRIGTNRGVSAYANGYIDDLRITKGVARYTANFTAPGAPFPDA